MNGWGGAREGAGRKATAGTVRGQHQVRATAEEWQIIKDFAEILKFGDKAAAKNFVENFKVQK